MPQGRRLFPSLSVEEHLTLIFRKIDSPDCWTPERVFDFFPELADRKKISGTKLNGGEQQMLAIGRALVTNTEALAEQIYIMLGGRTVYESAAQDFLENTELRQKYPGI